MQIQEIDVRSGAALSLRGRMRTFGRLTNGATHEPVLHTKVRRRAAAVLPVITLTQQR